MEFSIPSIDEALFSFAQERLDSLTKPKGSLGRLEEIAKRIVAIKGERFPNIRRKAVFVFAGDHGVTEEGVSAYPKEVTYQMVFNFLRGGAAINVFSRFANMDCFVVDMGVDYEFGDYKGLITKKVLRGTRNFTKGPAMTKEEAKRCIEIGRDLAHTYADFDYDLFCIGDMGIGNTTASSAIIASLLSKKPKEVSGRGTGVDEEGFARKIAVIVKGLEVNKPDPNDPIDVLSKVGGAEIGGMAGFILGATEKRKVVVLDGLISCASALIAYAIEPKVNNFLFAGHRSEEKGQWVALKHMNLEPILDLKMRLGEGTGAVLASIIIEAAIKMYNEMATFDEAQVSKKLK
jgi:nicotinate-nucleotide--dimethylbenzimidazole phosphoribosyltransferase